MSKIRVAFLGTPEFAVVSLKELLKDEHFEVVGVVTQPDRPSGRKLLLTPSPVKQLALSLGLKVISPESVNKDIILQEIQSWGAEVAVVVAFGQILSNKFLELFPHGAVNIHGSLLPKWRGAAPIQRSVEAGENETGVALQKIVKALDAGDVLGIRKTIVNVDETAMELHDRLAVLGADLLHVELMDYLRGNLVPTPQDETQVTFAKKLDKSESLIHWNQKSWDIHNKVRAFTMGPGTFTFLNGKKIKIHKTRWCEQKINNIVKTSAEPGVVLLIGKESIFVSAGIDPEMGVLEIVELQPESKNRMNASEFARGQNLQLGQKFG